MVTRYANWFVQFLHSGMVNLINISSHGVNKNFFYLFVIRVSVVFPDGRIPRLIGPHGPSVPRICHRIQRNGL